ncbi:TerB family tellurite resistance protein [uncultured Albimonas sp.]|uniref:tellurite resistance TerB family protein n=1 Tax=uncultured Albimonas sp. TaxID=1331701 RepID=UPI0030EF347E
MLRTLLAAFAQPEPPERLDTEDARLALAALMVRAARADDMYEASERTEILARLARRHALPEAQALALLEEAEALEAEAPDTVRFTRLLKQAVPYEDRTEVIEALWAVALADGARAPEEDAFLRQLAPLLGVSDQDSALARHRAARD